MSRGYRDRLQLAAAILGGQLVGISIEEGTLTFFDPATRVLLRTRPSPLTWDQARLLRGPPPAGRPHGLPALIAVLHERDRIQRQQDYHRWQRRQGN